MKQICGYAPEELKKIFEEEGIRPFHAKQVLEWIYQKGVLDWSKMSNLSKGLRDRLSQEWNIQTLKQKRALSSNDDTVKYLWELEDGKLVESVLINAPQRRTICVSSQVGCPARCAFCASGQEGLIRNLTAAEIVEQVLRINQCIEDRVTHIVFMGMGEPLENYEAVVKALRILTHSDLFNISQRRITVSTVGIIDGIERFAQEGLKVNLALSLHAPTQHIRKKIIPYARKNELSEILFTLDRYSEITGRDVTYEYTLISGINDHVDHAAALVKLVGRRQVCVNLIPYNPVTGLRLKRPDRDVIEAFRAVLTKGRVVNTCRYTKGDDIAAACGQLAMQT